MKKTLFVILSLIVSLTIQAQVEHMKFMGIPLSGTITQFQQKLQAKNIRYDSKLSSSLQSGCRMFKGIFSGKDANIFVYYDEKSKIVYRAKAVITYTGQEKAKSEFTNFKDLLCRKYPNHVPEESEQDGFPTYSLLLPNSQNKFLGSINLYISDTGYSFLDDFMLHIDYIDYNNGSTHEERNMEDL